MALFSKIKSAKKAANDHKDAKILEKEIENKPIPYRHVPTHAASDAMMGAPNRDTEENRDAIRAAHKRRSMMSRNDSGLSYSTQFSGNGGFHSSAAGLLPNRLESRRSYMGPSPVHISSPLASKPVSPSGSATSSTSSSSSQLLELPGRDHGMRASHRTSQPYPQRKVGEAPLLAVAPIPPLQKQPSVVVTPIQPKRKRFSFRKSTAIAAN